MKIHYLNTDLELESPNDLTPIVKEFGEDVFNLYNGKGRGHFLATFKMTGLVESPNSILQPFCLLAESLIDKEKALWDGCYKKIFDIGYEGGSSHNSYSDEIRAETLERVSALGASILVTIYPMNLDENEQKKSIQSHPLDRKKRHVPKR